ncbi:MAG: xanthine dehydrogenase family protein molybdopterin-binding subunit [Rhizobiaceae bacterium]
MAAARPRFGIGASALRVEDKAFLIGAGQYTDDLKVPGCLHGFVVRSQVSAGSFELRNVDGIRSMAGVRLVLTAKEVAHLKPLATSFRPDSADGSPFVSRDIPILCNKSVHYSGDAIAFIVADTLEQAEDAAGMFEVDYTQKETLVDAAEAVKPGAGLVWPELKSNIAHVGHFGNSASVRKAFGKSSKQVKIAFRQNRLASNYMETRAAIGEWRQSEGRFVLTLGSQGVHGIRAKLATDVFGMPHEMLRVVTKDVGGGFGPKAFAYREYALVLEAAKRLGKPVKWVGSRTEHFLTDAHGRDNVVEAEMALDDDGRFLALKVNLIANMGAYLSENAVFVPELGISMTTGLYDIPAIDVTIKNVYTNTCPVDAYRGAGRPEAAYLIERLADECARELGIAPDEIRRRNFIAKDRFPYTTAAGRTYDVGEFEGHLDLALAQADWSDFAKRREVSAQEGKLRGIGLSSYVEICAFDGGEPAFVTLRMDGSIELRIGTQSNGQGHATAYAQLASEKLNLPLDRIEVRQGDTDELQNGGGTGGSRSIPLGGASTVEAAGILAVRIRQIASDELEAAVDDIELADGYATVAGTDKRISFADVAKAARKPEHLSAKGDVRQEEGTYPNGTHVCEVEIDPQTGETCIVRYVAVDDFGVVVNPVLLAGQIHGGLAQGIAQALCEGVVYTPEGQLLTASFMDYAMPRADMFPDFEFSTRNVPSTANALGVKGAGEAATIAATPAVMNAVIDALWHACGISHIDMPATPFAIWQAIETAKAKA